MCRLEDNTLLLLVVVVSLVFAWILWPFFGAVLWAAVLAIVFAPLHGRLLRSMPKQGNLAALIIVLIILALVILPLTVTAAALVDEAVSLHQRIESGELDFGRFFQDVLNALPAWASNLLDRLGLANLGAVKGMLSAALTAGRSFFATQALDIGWSTASFIVSLLVIVPAVLFCARWRHAREARHRCDSAARRSTAGSHQQIDRGHPRHGQGQSARGHDTRRARRPHFLAAGDPCPGSMGLGDGSSIFAARGGLHAYLASSRHIFASDRCCLAGRDSAGLWHIRHGLRGQLAAAAPRRERHADAGLPRTDFHARRNRNLRSWRIYCGTGGRLLIRCCLGHIFGFAASSLRV
jgi:AI-2E family transporter